MLSSEAFAKGLFILNSILAESAKINSEKDMEVYYGFIKDKTDDIHFLKGIEHIVLSWENSYKKPTVKNILDAIKKGRYGDLSEDEIELIEEELKKSKKTLENKENPSGETPLENH